MVRRTYITPRGSQAELATVANAALRARVRALETENQQERRRTFVDAAVASGRVTESQRQSLGGLYDRDPVTAGALVASLPAGPVAAPPLTEAENRAYVDATAERLSIPKDRIV